MTLYRGVNESHPGYENALKGNAFPRGGAATPLEYNTLTTQSSYTSWSTDVDVAVNYALRPNGSGVVLETTVPVSKAIKSPNLHDVNLIHKPGVIVSENEWLLQGRIKGARTNWVTPE